jgi:hypothetical protein
MFLGVKFHYNLRALYQPFLFGRCLFNNLAHDLSPLIHSAGWYAIKSLVSNEASVSLISLLVGRIGTSIGNFPFT